MFKKYKNWRKIKYEIRLKEFVEFNLKRIEEFESDLDINTILKDNYSICQNYRKEYLYEIQHKYEVDENLINQVLTTENQAIKKYFKKCEEEKLLEKDKQRRKEIDLYKEAILELKKENRI